MAPTDNSPTHTGGFELISSLEAYNRIPVYEFKSRRTGLTIVLAEVEGPVVNGYFCLATEAHDDDGLPHTLEHLIFLGSEQYPYKGVLDLLANRCLASGTNAWTDIDHTCYTMETAGSEGFLSLMPIFLEHILYPTLTDQGFLTEVHHITEKGEDAGVVYCEMQGRENSGESRVHLSMARAMYPGDCGYSAETGGIMKNLRESTTNEKVRNYHKEFYRPENLKVIITGQVKPEDVFKALAALEEKIVSKGERTPFTRPWLNPVPPLPESLDQEVNYPCDEESNGIVSVSWRGPSAVTEQYMLSAASIILKYLTDFSVSPLQKEFVEIPDPYASKVAYNLYENSESVLYLLFENVPKEKLTLVKPRLVEVLKNIVANEDIDMNRLRSVIHRHKLESLSNLENNPHQTVAFMIIGHMLYGRSKEDLEQRLNPVIDLEKMESEPKGFWIALINKYFVEGNVISICGIPSIEEQHKMAEEEKQRIEAQIAKLTAAGLKQKGTELEEAIAFNEKPPPTSMLTSVPIPSTESINFHEIVRSSSLQCGDMDLSSTPVLTYFDHVNTNFVYMFVLMDTSKVPLELRLYLPLLLEAFFESPVKRGNTVVPYEDIVSELESDTVATRNHIGLGNSGRFSCGPYSHTVSIMLQVEEAKYKRGIDWLRELLYQTQFTVDRIQIIATKMANDVSQIKRKGNKVAADLMKGLCYIKDSNQYNNSMLRQQKFLTDLLENLKTKPNEVLENIEQLRKIITDPSNMVLYLAANTNHISDLSGEALEGLLPPEMTKARTCLNVTPDSELIVSQSEAKNCVVGMGCIESSFLYHVTPCISTYNDPDVPALMIYLQYITQLEGPLWKQVRGKGLTYGYNICLKANEGLLYLVFSRATNVVAAFKEAQDIVTKQVTSGTWDQTLLESAKSSLIFEIIENEKSIGHVVEQSLVSYFKKVDYSYNRWLVSYIGKVTEADLNRVGEKYVSQLFEPAKTRTTIVCHPAKAEEIAAGFKEMNFPLEVFPSLEKSFLNQW